MGLYGANAPNFCVSFLLRLLFSLKCRNQNCENPYQNHQTKNEKMTKSALIFERLCFIFWNFFHRAVALPVSNVGDWILMDIPKPMIKCCRLIVLICVSVVLPFHKCLRLLRLGLYTVSTPRVNNDAAIVAHICYISLLRCNYVCWDATITTSIWLVNRKTFVNGTLSSRGTEY